MFTKQQRLAKLVGAVQKAREARRYHEMRTWYYELMDRRRMENFNDRKRPRRQDLVRLIRQLAGIHPDPRIPDPDPRLQGWASRMFPTLWDDWNGGTDNAERALDEDR